MQPLDRGTLDIAAARVAIAEVRSADLKSVSIEDLKHALIPVFRGYIVTAPKCHPGLDLFRARLMTKPTYVRDLLYPPNGIAPLGRANREGASVLYCCSSREASFFELAPIVGSTLVVSKWVTIAPLLLNHVGYSRDVFSRLGSARRDHSWSDRPIDDHGEANAEVAAFLADAFAQRVATQERYRYKLSAAIAEKLFDADLFDGLLYPSIAMQANSNNVAIKPRYADQHLRFVRAEFARIDIVRDLQFDITVLDTAVALGDDGTIEWRGRLDNWVLRNKGDQITMSVENGHWVARNVHGNVVEPE
jgi:hypothetical protein